MSSPAPNIFEQLAGTGNDPNAISGTPQQAVGTQPVTHSTDNIFNHLANNGNDPNALAKGDTGTVHAAVEPRFSESDEGHQNRMSALAGLTGMPTINMSEQDKQSFEKGKAAGALSVPAVAGGVTGVTAAAEAIPAVLPHTIEGVKALGEWAVKHPMQAYILYQVVKEMIPGAKKALGLVKEAPSE